MNAEDVNLVWQVMAWYGSRGAKILLKGAICLFLYHIVYVPKRLFKGFEARSSLINIQAMYNLPS